MSEHLYLWGIPLLPLAGSLACGLLHLASLRARRAPSAAPGREIGSGALAPLVACASVAGALALSIAGFVELAGLEPAARVVRSPAWRWIEVGDFRAPLELLFDPLSSVLALVVTGVGFLIHVYSAGYMKGDPGYAKFFAFLNLFVFAMLVLVLSSNLLGLFIGWEGVGLCSYLLIGFWYAKGWPAEAAQKAFVMNRIGDACFLAGSFLLVSLFGTLDMADVGASVAQALHDPTKSTRIALAALLLFGGCCGKSAQFPLFTWLPDAMAGPTPVSALIHAATMVPAGIYLVVRLNPLFAASPGAMAVIATIGALTAFIGATSAMVQRDIKKVLAYSTVSQLGYMFLALGSGAFAAAIFHLVTHAFFKGLLFLGAGSVIHGLHDEQDLHRMGGLKRHMPRTWLTFLAGAAALSGLPLASGFFSKDEILASTFAAGGFHYALWALGLFTAALTAFYTWRMVALAFHGRERFDVQRVHPHESPAVMTVPLAVLAVLSLAGGVLGLPEVIGIPHALATWLEPVLASGRRVLASHQHAEHLPHALEWTLLALGAAVALVFAHLGFRTYREGIEADRIRERTRPALADFLSRAWGVDEGYARRVVMPVRLLAFVTAIVVDQFLIDGLVNGSAALARAAGERSRRLADGRLESYGMWMGAGAVLIAFVWLWS